MMMGGLGGMGPSMHGYYQSPMANLATTAQLAQGSKQNSSDNNKS